MENTDLIGQPKVVSILESDLNLLKQGVIYYRDLYEGAASEKDEELLQKDIEIEELKKQLSPQPIEDIDLQGLRELLFKETTIEENYQEEGE